MFKITSLIEKIANALADAFTITFAKAPALAAMPIRIIAFFVVVAVMLAPMQNVQAQSSTTLGDPLIPGAVSTAPFIPAPRGQRPAIGSGPTPAPVVPGMGGPSTLLPWVPAVPANDIDLK